MHSHSMNKWQHQHDFIPHNHQGEKRTWYVLILTLVAMVAEIVAGTVFGSMALLADGWHMATHAAAFILTLFTYRYARRHAHDKSFSFGTGKVSVLGGFTSAIALGLVALIMMAESVHRFFSPQPIHFDEAIMVAIIGLIVNVISVFLLKDDHHHHGHHHGHSHHHNHQNHRHNHHSHEHHEHSEKHQDYNLKAAYFHVMADALTSVLAIFALLLGKYYGWNWMDALMGIVGAVIITRWAMGLIQQTSPILLDCNIAPGYQDDIVSTLERESDIKVSDIHIWKISADHYAAIISVVSHEPLATDEYKKMLRKFDKLHHLTIEINQCHDT